MLDALGYESKMIFVNTSLEFAQQRNEARLRKTRTADCSNRVGKSAEEHEKYEESYLVKIS